MPFSSILFHKIGDLIVDSRRRPWGRRRKFPEEILRSSNPCPFLSHNRSCDYGRELGRGELVRPIGLFQSRHGRMHPRHAGKWDVIILLLRRFADR